jgi:hypothetical protein
MLPMSIYLRSFISPGHCTNRSNYNIANLIVKPSEAFCGVKNFVEASKELSAQPLYSLGLHCCDPPRAH